MRDAAGRHDTQNQRYAKVASAERRKCPECGRKSAMVKTPDIENVYAYCRWCGFERRRKDDAHHSEGASRPAGLGEKGQRP
jgi:hypothetical protein